ncbi:MAG TPA: rhodanese-like domain-containing protein, partial [Polyangiaceae bacterium]|nr:rhodanese-like domain-containing protein [Polyangiaceae bacterium]
MTHSITVQEVRTALQLRQELALLDLRQEASFASGHPLFAAQLPLDRIEIEAPVRIPRRDTLLVLYGEEGDAERAQAQFERLGYTRVALLAGGLAAWRAAGFELFEDVNSYSKAFGELVEARRHTPSLSAEEVGALIAQKADIAIVDARRFEEYQTMSIPTGTSVPGAELVLRVPALAPDSHTTVVVNCAGRTRSIIGAQSLIN